MIVYIHLDQSDYHYLNRLTVTCNFLTLTDWKMGKNQQRVSQTCWNESWHWCVNMQLNSGIWWKLNLQILNTCGQKCTVTSEYTGTLSFVLSSIWSISFQMLYDRHIFCFLIEECFYFVSTKSANSLVNESEFAKIS